MVPEPQPPLENEPTETPWYERGGPAIDPPATTPADEPVEPERPEPIEDTDAEDTDAERIDTERINTEPPPSDPVEAPPARPAEPVTPEEPQREEREPEEPNEPDDGFKEGFAFGSYGRVVAASNLDGGLGRDADIVAFHPRIDEDVYFELELRRQDRLAHGMRSRVVATVAFGGPFFHFDGQFQESIAVRNLFAEIDNIFVDGLSLWAGSRMVRGDDVYLLNFWPMDNLNTIGGGMRLNIRDSGQFALTAGLSRPEDPFHRQVRDAVPRAGFLPDDVVVLDRPRLTVAAKGTWWLMGRTARNGIKLNVYGEGHFLPSGERELDGFGIEQLPSDGGFVLGAQVGGYLANTNAFFNLFVRYAGGLGAYDPLGVPFRAGGVTRTSRAREFRLALSANWESGAFGVQVGAYYRRFRDADPNLFQRGQLAEGAIIARPHVWFGDHAGVSLDLSYQGMQTSALDEATGTQVGGGVTKIGFIPFVSFFGRGTYTRPHLRLIYSISIRSEGARRLYPDEDPRSQNAAEHFLGIGAEWWFDSTSYGF